MRSLRSRVHSASQKFLVDRPARTISPVVGTSSPATKFSKVLFPHPLGPINAQNCPFGTCRVTSRRAATTVLPVTYSLQTWSSLTTLLRAQESCGLCPRRMIHQGRREEQPGSPIPQPSNRSQEPTATLDSANGNSLKHRQRARRP